MGVVTVRFSDTELKQLDEIVERGLFKSRSAAIKVALFLLNDKQQDELIDAAYVEAYTKYPQEEWIGEAGPIMMGRALKAR